MTNDATNDNDNESLPTTSQHIDITQSESQGINGRDDHSHCKFLRKTSMQNVRKMI